jgi:hypothetical protein
LDRLGATICKGAGTPLSLRLFYPCPRGESKRILCAWIKTATKTTSV